MHQVIKNNVVDVLNATGKHYLKREMELMGKLASNDTTNIGMLPSLQNMHPLTLQINVYILS